MYLALHGRQLPCLKGAAFDVLLTSNSLTQVEMKPKLSKF